MNQNICNNCGSDYEYRGGRWVCPFCGAYKAETISGEEMSLLYSAFQKLRLAEFFEAEQEFEDIVGRYPENPSAYWGRLMAKYGIKYERDYDGKMIPTCYAASLESVYASSDYSKAMEYADEDNAAFYQQQAMYIERVRKEWIGKAKKEEPYDIFICYKDSDKENGIDHTPDSNDMMDLYIRLQNKGYRVFFSRVSLTDKGGEKYEPYIFNALATAKVMIVYGSKPAYITSAWVKNEWTRYGKRVQSGEKHADSLLVAYKGFDPVELPAPLRSRQCFDAGKITFFDDLIQKLETLIDGEKTEEPQETPSAEPGTERTSPNGLKYVVNEKNKTCVITYIGDCTATNVITPAKIDGYAVTGIGKEAFVGCSTLKSIVISKGVTEIGDGAFSGCRGLTSVLLPKGILRIGERAFFDCRGLTSVSIPDSVTRIGDFAFRSCHGLKSVDIPRSVTRIGEEAFADCVSMTDIRYDGTETLWNRIVLAQSWRKDSPVKTITGSDGKFGSRGLEYTINSDMKTCTLTGIGDCADTNFIIPGTIDGYAVTVIGDHAFKDCKELKSVTIPGGVTEIGEGAFEGCENLKNATIPKGVTSIGNGAFWNCGNLMSADIPKTVKSIGTGAFRGCAALKGAVIPHGVTEIAGSAFSGCGNLASVVIPNTVKSIGSAAFHGCGSLKSVNVPNSVKSIGYSAFQDCRNLRSFVIPSGVKCIGDSTFKNCTGLTNVKIPSSVKTIDNRAFEDCCSLESIVIPNGVKSIGYNAFSGCSDLQKIKIPKSVTSIEGGNENGRTFKVSKSNPSYYSDKDGKLKKYNDEDRKKSKKATSVCEMLTVYCTIFMALIVFLALRNGADTGIKDGLLPRMKEGLLPLIKSLFISDDVKASIFPIITMILAPLTVAIVGYMSDPDGGSGKLSFSDILRSVIMSAILYFVWYGVYHLLFWFVYALLWLIHWIVSILFMNQYIVYIVGGLCLCANLGGALFETLPGSKDRKLSLLFFVFHLAATIVCFYFAHKYVQANEASSALTEAASYLLTRYHLI